ncbi:murein biosynthesis integral membrane protein MurJ [Streptomyces sp. NBC_00233]|uniref:murein biosynthesis integral membrane protein MurJ n=1 Tax=Streptomyces sp. NBC_00233 TaxID=2975686 RepID=UPI0022587BC3|nr:murein biosynthesis integral membrane protein MurJ [Streptomyces sp. NBC_00233]MCX5233343.1 murein biosynthesis integral membrane protein MurJ [Streptomyces sp. NBC_00233]
MVLGSLTSRVTGFLRSAVVVAALGTGLGGDAYAVANTLPNIVFMLLLGGALNSVFVSELVRAARHSDGGAVFTDRLVTACLASVLVLSVAAVVAAPWLVDLYAPMFTGSQRGTTVVLARYCLPQIFFYGVFAALGQVLNAREQFGAMMWAPVVNNLVVSGVFGLYLAFASHADGPVELSSGQAVWLGAGSTVGIVVQALVLLPSLRRSGYQWRPRFDWRNAGLARPLRAAGWALLLVAVGQAAFWAVTVLATGVSEHAAADGLSAGAGLTAYNSAYQLWVVPQGIITVSLATAALPSLTRAAQAGDHAALANSLARTVRTPAGIIVLAAMIFLVLSEQLANLAYGYGTVTQQDVQVLGQVLAAFALGLPAFCIQYTLTRAFYALGDARAPVLLAVLTSGTNIALSTAAVHTLPTRWAVAGMAGAHTLACLAGAAATATVLRRRIRPRAAAQPPGGGPPSFGTHPTASDGLTQLSAHARAAVACLPGAAAAFFLTNRASDYLGDGAVGSVTAVAVGSTLMTLSLLLLARPLRIGDSVTAPFRLVLHRVPKLPTRTTAGHTAVPRHGGTHRRHH